MPKTVKPTAAKKAAPKKVRITASVIAKDVLRLLATKKVKAVSGNYLRIDRRYNSQRDLKSVMEQPSFKCEACVVGAMFAAVVSRVNEATVADTRLAHRMRTRLQEYIPDEQLRLIEAAFESNAYFASGLVPRERIAEAVAFGREFDSDRERLEAISKNMLAHGGMFKP